MELPGSGYLTMIIHALSQCLLIPVVLGLILLMVFGLMELGSFISERKQRKTKGWGSLINLLHDVGDVSPWKIRNLQQVIENSPFHNRQKNLLIKLLSKANFSRDAKELIARDILDREESEYKRLINKTDLLARLGPMLGLMGTLIPLGPGLGALGQGDFQGLSQAIIVAFDTTVVGMLIGGLGAFISKIRTRWYTQDLNSLEVVLDLIIGGEDSGSQENEAPAAMRRRN